MATIHIDNQAYTAKDGENMLQQILSLGLDLPYFCWHPALGSVGACRQCAIKQFKNPDDAHGKIVMACVTPVADGARISVEDPEARAFRAAVIEWMMTNHPHDCPVCDEGGECHLQDMTVMTGHAYRRYEGRKRTFRNQYLGPLVNHEMNRCIQCYRCVRFYRDYAGGRDLDALMLRNQVYFGRQHDGVLESEFSGNLVEVCPTGVFTDKTLKRHYARKWDLQTAPSICVYCSLGCNTLPGERYGTLRRMHNRYNGAVNGYFLCDRGRFGYEFANGDRRIRQARWRNEPMQAALPYQPGESENLPAQPDASRIDLDATLQVVEKEALLRRLATWFASDARLIGIGSPRASLEANFALRTLVGPERFHSGMSDQESHLVATVLDILRAGPARTPSLHEVEQADAVLVLGEDVTNTAPLLALALRQSRKNAERIHIPDWDDGALRHALQQQRGPLFIASAGATRLDDAALQTFRGTPDEVARLGFAVAHALDAAAPALDDLPPDAMRTMVDRIAQALKTAERPLVVSGTGCGSEAVVRAAANIAAALCGSGRNAELCYAVPECNSIGMALMESRPLGAALRAVQEDAIDTVIILENDLYRRADAASVDALFAWQRAAIERHIDRHILAIDHITHATCAQADVVLPAAAFAEADGTLVNNEGRAQRFFQVYVPQSDSSAGIQESWRWMRDIMVAAGRASECRWASLDQLTAACAAAIPALRMIGAAAPGAGFRINHQRIPREPHRYSGRTAMHADVSVHEPQPPPADPDAPLAFSMEGYPGHPPPPLIPIFWAPGWDSVQAVNKYQGEVGAALRGGDPGVRLIEPLQTAQAVYGGAAPRASFKPRAGEHLLLPLHHIFGSEELSVLAPGIAELAATPYLAINPDDAATLAVRAGDDVRVQLEDAGYRLPVQLRGDLPPGVAGLPAGLPGLAGIALPAWGRIAAIATTASGVPS